MRYVIFFILLVLFTINYFMGGHDELSGNLSVRMISYFNFLLFFSSIVCVVQFIWPGDTTRVLYQVFNLVFIIVFYTFSFNYLVNHKDYYDGYANLTDFDVLKHFAFRWDIFSIMFWFIAATFFVNIIYVYKYKEGEIAYA